MRHQHNGFSLFEMLLVSAILAGLIIMAVGFSQRSFSEQQISRSTEQIQQILVAATAYYTVCNTWPSNLANLQQTSGTVACGNTTLSTTGFLPAGSLKTPWGTTYGVTSTDKNFYVMTEVKSSTQAKAFALGNILAGHLPFAYVANTNAGLPPPRSSAPSARTFVVAQIGIPVQNLNKAMAINFAGIYHHGACVPVPQCKVDVMGNTMVPQVYVMPVSVSGMNDIGNVFPISSFTAYATAMSSSGVPPNPCTSGGVAAPCNAQNPAFAGEKYWRVCLQVVTTRGLAAPTGWGEKVSIAAFTRCAPNTEPMSGSDYTDTNATN